MKIEKKSKISEFGEVFTSEKEVNSMIELVKNELERIESRFLEPACGDGNFLSVVLTKKLEIVYKKYKKSLYEFEFKSLIAISSIYGIEIQEEHVDKCVFRLYEIWLDFYKKVAKDKIDKNLVKSIQYILKKNIVLGNALTYRNDLKNQPILFSEWNKSRNNQIIESIFSFEYIVSDTKVDNNQISLFQNELDFDEKIDAFIPKAIENYPPISFKELYKNGEKQL